MEIFYTIKHMFPDATIENVTVGIMTDGSWEILKWDLPEQKPSKEEVENYWNANEQEILDTCKPRKTDIEILQDTIIAIMDLLP